MKSDITTSKKAIFQVIGYIYSVITKHFVIQLSQLGLLVIDSFISIYDIDTFGKSKKYNLEQILSHMTFIEV